MLVKSRVLRGNYDWHDILRRDCAQEIKRCKKPGLPERVMTNTQAVLRLAWGGLAKGNQSVQQAKARVDFLVGTWRKEISRCNKPSPGLPSRPPPPQQPFQSSPTPSPASHHETFQPLRAQAFETAPAPPISRPEGEKKRGFHRLHY